MMTLVSAPRKAISMDVYKGEKQKRKVYKLVVFKEPIRSYFHLFMTSRLLLE